MFEYRVTIDGISYRVKSDRELTPEEAYQAVLAQRPAQQPSPQPQLSEYEQYKAGVAELRERIAWLKQQIAELAAEPNKTLDIIEAEDQLRQHVRALEKQLPPDYAGIGGTIGSVVGGVAGAAVPGASLPLSVAGSVVGGLIGTVVGGLLDARGQKMDAEETERYLTERGIESVVFDTVGNLVFIGGGKIVGRVMRNSPEFPALVKRLGGKIKAGNTGALRVPAERIVPGEAVFPTTTAQDLQRDALVGATKLTRVRGPSITTPTTGQLTGEPGMLEAVARQRDRGYFQRLRREQEGMLEQQVAKALQQWRGKQTHAFAGDALMDALDSVERAGKAYLRPYFQALDQENIGIAFSDIREEAQQLLAREGQRIPVLDGEELKWIRRFADAPEFVKVSDAHELASRMAARARDLEKAAQPDSRLQRFYAMTADRLRERIEQAMGGQAGQQYEEARAVYREMMKTLYDPALAPARRAAESKAGSKVIAQGEVEGVEALRRLQDFARDLDARLAASAPPGVKLKSKLGEKAAEAQRAVIADFFEKTAGTPEALARLPRRMADPDFRRTFIAAFPSAKDRRLIERLAQSAQIIQRLGYSPGTAPGIEAGGASLGGALGSSTGSSTAARAGAFLGRWLAVLTPARLARAMTRPELRAELPRAARIAEAAARGASPEIPAATWALLDALEGADE